MKLLDVSSDDVAMRETTFLKESDQAEFHLRNTLKDLIMMDQMNFNSL